MTKANFAKKLGVSKAVVSQALRDGRIVENDDGTISDSQLEAFRLNTTGEDRNASGKDENLTYWRTRKAKAEALIKETELAKLKDSLIDKKATLFSLKEILIAMKKNLEALPQRSGNVAASKVKAGQSYEKAIEQAIGEDIERILIEAMDRIESL